MNTYPRMGFIKDLRNFDASFFGMHPKLAERTDPIVRTLLETSAEAVIDAGATIKFEYGSTRMKPRTICENLKIFITLFHRYLPYHLTRL